MQIFKLLWRIVKFIRELVINIVFVLFTLALLTIISVFNHYSNKSPAKLVGDQGALLLDLNGYLADNREQPILWQDALRELDNQPSPHQISTFDVIYAIENAAKDERIRGLVLDLNWFKGGDFTSLENVGQAIEKFKQSQKPVVAFADNYTQSQYFLASFADHIYLNPIGQVEITGLHQENLYFKSLLDKLDISTHIFRVGTYKSAVEPFLRNNMSDEARADMRQWLDQIWKSYQQTVATNRQIDKSAVLPEAKNYIKALGELKGDSSLYAKQRGLITEFATRYQIEQKLTALFGQDKYNTPKLLPLEDYLAALPDIMTTNAKQKIAVVSVEGAIIDGENDEQGVGGDSVARLLHQAYRDEDIKAVVLRVNSPGGSAFASEIIRQELVHLQQAGKPVVVSMGGMAASGGYWISATADYIVAEKNTITGSIGIFSVLPSFEKTLRNIGISSDGVSTSPLSQFSSTSGLSNELSQILQLEIEQGYDRFLTLVSEGRKLPKSAVDKLAQGRIWLGIDAFKHKLVDEIGSIEVAIDKAIELVKQKDNNQTLTDEFGVFLLQEDSYLLFGGILKGFQYHLKTELTKFIGNTLGLPQNYQGAIKQIGILNKMNDPKGHYLYCLTCSKVD